MKFLQLVPAMEQGGVERGIVESNRILVAAGFENVVVAAGGRLLERVQAEGGRVLEMDVKSKNPLTFFTRAWKLRALLKREKPAIVVAHSRVPAWLFVWANRTLHLPWITFAHGANSISRYSRVMTAGHLTVTPSRFLADYLKKAYQLDEAKIRVIPRAIDAKRFDTANLDDAFMRAKRAAWHTDGAYVIMGVGRITQLKGYDTLIRALAQVRQLDAALNYRLVIVGEAEVLRQDVAENLRRLVSELGVKDHVVFAGNQQKIAECLTLANVVVSSNTSKPEAFGRSMAEALAMNRPVVATGFGGALDIVEDGVNGALVPCESADFPAAFAQAIKRVAHTTFGDLRTPALEKFSFARMAEKTLAVYRELSLSHPITGA